MDDTQENFMNANDRKNPNSRLNSVEQAQGAPQSDPKAEVKKESEEAKVAPTEVGTEKTEAPAQADTQDTKR
jgi:hypothetical protein